MLVAAISLSAAEKTYNLTGSIKGLTNACAVDIYYTPAPAAKATTVKVVGPKEMIEKITVKNAKGELTVSAPANSIVNGYKKLKVYVTGPVYGSYKALASGDIKCVSDIACANISVNATASGDIEFQTVTCDKATITATASGDIEIHKLMCKAAATISASASGDVEVDAINAASITATASASGDVELEGIVTGALTATATSSGDIRLSGRADTATLTANSSGEINALKLNAAKMTVNKNGSGAVKIKKN